MAKFGYTMMCEQSSARALVRDVVATERELLPALRSLAPSPASVG